jgi:hypothetical protein
LHERSVNKPRFGAIQRIRSERYAAAKASDPQGVAEFEKKAESQRKK